MQVKQIFIEGEYKPALIVTMKKPNVEKVKGPPPRNWIGGLIEREPIDYKRKPDINR